MNGYYSRFSAAVTRVIQLFAPDQRRFRFLDLPLELQDYILSLLVGSWSLCLKSKFPSGALADFELGACGTYAFGATPSKNVDVLTFPPLYVNKQFRRMVARALCRSFDGTLYLGLDHWRDESIARQSETYEPYDDLGELRLIRMKYELLKNFQRRVTRLKIERPLFMIDEHVAGLLPRLKEVSIEACEFPNDVVVSGDSTSCADVDVLVERWQTIAGCIRMWLVEPKFAELDRKMRERLALRGIDVRICFTSRFNLTNYESNEACFDRRPWDYVCRYTPERNLVLLSKKTPTT